MYAYYLRQFISLHSDFKSQTVEIWAVVDRGFQDNSTKIAD